METLANADYSSPDPTPQDRDPTSPAKRSIWKHPSLDGPAVMGGDGDHWPPLSDAAKGIELPDSKSTQPQDQAPASPAKRSIRKHPSPDGLAFMDADSWPALTDSSSSAHPPPRAKHSAHHGRHKSARHSGFGGGEHSPRDQPDRSAAAGWDHVPPFYRGPPPPTPPTGMGPYMQGAPPFMGPPPPAWPTVPMVFYDMPSPVPPVYMERERIMMLQQIEYYFSNDNLCKDLFLRRHMDGQGWVDISLIAGFKRVQRLKKDLEYIKQTVQCSSVLEMKDDKIRKHNDWEKWVIPRETNPDAPPSSASVPRSNANDRTTHLGGMRLHESASSTGTVELNHHDVIMTTFLRRYSGIPVDDVRNACPACRGIRNCKVCLQGDNLIKGEMSSTSINEFPTSSSLGAMGPLLRKLDLLLDSKNQLTRRSKEAIKLLKEDLKKIIDNLVELSIVEHPNYKTRYWMHEVRELSYHIEDSIDNLVQSRGAAEAKRFCGRSPQLSVRRHVKILCLAKNVKPFASLGLGLRRTLILSLSSCLVRHPGFPKQFSRRHESRHDAPLAQLHQALLLICPPPLSVRIAELRTMLREASERHERYQLQDCVSEPRFLFSCNSRAPALWSGAGANLVGIDGTRGMLTNWLIDQTEEEHQQLKVLSILGPGGVGKTALVKELYRQLGHQFERRVFVRVSRNPDMRRLLGEILAQVQGCKRDYEYEAASTADNLMDSIRSHLQDKRYFVVIDELWDAAAWDIMNIAFPKGNNCSRIIITADGKDVASKCYYVNNLEMTPLGNLQDSGKIFFDRVFGSEHQCRDQRKDISRMIIRSCGGFPLAITSIASLLASERDNTKLWDYLRQCFVSRLTGVTLEEICKEVINICYDALPQDLKTCLLYLTIYPDGSTIRKADLLNQWIAEGFITPKEENQTVAESYFAELINRGMIQPEKVDHNDDVLSCTVHHIVFDLIAQKSREENFITAVDYSQAIPGFSMIARRLTLHFSCAKFAAKPEGLKLSQVRSLAFYGLLKCMPSITEFKFLRVLILEFWGDNYHHNTSIDPSKFCILFHLRYLKVSSHIVIVLPSQIRRLKSLETLEIDAQVSAVPTDILHLPGLLHLSLPKGTELPDGIGHITSLQTLEHFDVGSNSEDNAQSLGELINLQSLHVTCSRAVSDHHLKRNLVALFSSIGKLVNLKSLRVGSFAVGMAMFVDQHVSSRAPELLERLHISPSSCIFSTLPTWIGGHEKLRILKIAVRVLLSSDIDSLTGLPVLAVLSLYVQKPNAESIIFNSGSLPALKYFKYRCGALRLGFQEEALPNLQRLKLCFNVHRAESYTCNLVGIENLLKLREITAEIGAAAGAHESDRRAAGSALKEATQKHPRFPIHMIVKSVDCIEEESTPERFMHLIPYIVKSVDSIGSEMSSVLGVTEVPTSSSLGAMGPLLWKLDSLLASESHLPRTAKEAITLLKEDVEEIMDDLVDLSMVERPNHKTRYWMQQVRELSCHIEDCVDNMMQSQTDAKAKVRFSVRHLPLRVRLHVKIPRLPKIVKPSARIAELRKLLWEARCEKYQLEDCVSSEPRFLFSGNSGAPAMAAAVAGAADNLVGVDGTRGKLTSWLIDQTEEEHQQLKVLSILGPGGVGKTALVKELYHQLGHQFECRAFVRVSRNPDMRRLLGEILAQVQGRKRDYKYEAAFTEDNLMDTIRSHLQDKRYFVVIDELWDAAAWDIMNIAFPKGHNCSRIIITAEGKDVAITTVNNLEMTPLGSLQDYGKIFFDRVFGSENQCPDQLMDISLLIIRSCGGFPLAITTVASLLASQRDNTELWDYLQQCFASRLTGATFFEKPVEAQGASTENFIREKEATKTITAKGTKLQKNSEELHSTGVTFFEKTVNFIKEKVATKTITAKDTKLQKNSEELHSTGVTFFEKTVEAQGASTENFIKEKAATKMITAKDTKLQKKSKELHSTSSLRARGVTLEETCKEIVNICYDALPQDLKTCLLYLTMYPEWTTIRKADLLNQWIAEGFITHKKENKTVAESYFTELINRGMIQPEKINHDNEVLSCTVHHIVFDVIAQKSREENFITAVDYRNFIKKKVYCPKWMPKSSMPKSSMVAGRLSLHFSCVQFAAKPEGLKLSQVWSLAFYGLLKCMPSITKYKFLRVMILEFWGDDHYMTSFNLSKLCMLFQLRYLKISSHMFIVLPSQIRRLQSLETLEIYAKVSAVPTDILHLPGLLHLSLPNGTELPDGIGRITSLQTLEHFDVGSNSEDNAQSLGELINLQSLHVTCSRAVSDHHLKRNLVALSSSIGKLVNLKSLRVGPFAVGMTMFIDQDDMPCAPKHLQRLELLPSSFIFSGLPTWIGGLECLRILKIAVRVLLRSQIDTLTGLPVLAVLSLYVQKPNAESVIFNSGSLPALKYFKYRCAAFRLAFENEALPNLQRLKLCFNVHGAESYASNLAGIENLLKLKEITAEIGAAAGAHESDRRAAESALKEATRKHPRFPIHMIVKSVDCIEEESTPERFVHHIPYILGFLALAVAVVVLIMLFWY